MASLRSTHRGTYHGHSQRGAADRHIGGHASFDTHTGSQRRPSLARTLLAGVVLGLSLAAALSLGLAPVLTSPAGVAANAAPTEFSAGRALQHLQVIARAPHPIGSPEHALVASYIVEQLRGLGAGTKDPDHHHHGAGLDYRVRRDHVRAGPQHRCPHTRHRQQGRTPADRQLRLNDDNQAREIPMRAPP